MPGSPQTNMYFTLYGFNTLEQALGLVRDLKMVRLRLDCCTFSDVFCRACVSLPYKNDESSIVFSQQYNKLPPRVTFTVQALGAVVVRITCQESVYLCSHAIVSPGRPLELRDHEGYHHYPSRDSPRCAGLEYRAAFSELLPCIFGLIILR